MTHATLTDALAPHAVDYEALRAQYAPFLHLGRRLLGVESNVYPYMEIWPISFRTYNLMIPNFINLPLPMLGITPGIAIVGTAMYASSRAAGCMYCSAHCCTIAMRAGADEGLLRSIQEPTEQHTEAERAVLRVAARMSTIPESLTADDLSALDANFRREAGDWITHAVSMMGFLNKMMDALGVDLEEALVQEVGEVAAASGWSAGRHRVVEDDRPKFAPAGGPLRTLLAMLPHLPRAILQDKAWQGGIPSNGSAAGALLAEMSGYGFPMVAAIKQGRIVRTLTTMVRDNLLPEESAVGLATKHAVGLVFAAGIGNSELAEGARVMGAAVGLTALDELEALGSAGVDLHDEAAAAACVANLDEPLGAAVLLARAMSTSPVSMTPAVVSRVTAALGAAQIMEIVTWISVLALLHRVHVVQQVRDRM